MKAALRKIFNPTFLILLVLLVEVLLIVGVVGAIYYLIEFAIEAQTTVWIYVGLRILLTLAQLIVFLFIVDKDENPEYKIPWMAFLALLPVLTVVLYAIFANHGLRPEDKKILKPSLQIARREFALKKDEVESFREQVPARYRALFKYLRRTTELETTTGNRFTYYKNGEQFFPEFVESLKQAKRFIFMEFFIIGEGKWWSQIEEVLLQKAKEGVEVRLIYDDMGSWGTLPPGYDKKMRRHGIKCFRFHPFSPIISGVFNNRDHRKICVIDHKMGFTGGMNLADEYANDELRFGYWKDTMIKVEGKAIRNMIATFLTNYDLAQKRVSDYNLYVQGQYEEYEDQGYCFFFGDGPGAYSRNNPIGEENYLQLINAATKSLWICTPYYIPTYRLSEALISAAKRGVEVKLFVPGIPDKKPVYWMAQCEFKKLVTNGIHVYVYDPGFNHEKQLIADEEAAFVGTINFDFRSLAHHFECGMTMYGTSIIPAMVDDFLEMENVSYKVPEDYRVSFGKRIFVDVLRIFRTLL